MVKAVSRTLLNQMRLFCLSSKWLYHARPVEVSQRYLPLAETSEPTSTGALTAQLGACPSVRALRRPVRASHILFIYCCSSFLSKKLGTERISTNVLKMWALLRVLLYKTPRHSLISDDYFEFHLYASYLIRTLCLKDRWVYSSSSMPRLPHTHVSKQI